MTQSWTRAFAVMGALVVIQTILATDSENGGDLRFKSAITPDRAAYEAKKNIAETAHDQTDEDTAEKNRVLKHVIPF